MSTKKEEVVRAVINNVPAPFEHYVESHWNKKLEEKIEEFAKNAKPDYPMQIAITGTPGSGKTELAKYYAHKHASKSSMVWSIVADTPENLWRNYRLLADRLGINSKKKSDEDNAGWHKRIRDRVNEILSKNPGWVLIFDNVKQLSDVTEFLPKTGKQKGIILITSRDAHFMDGRHMINISAGLDGDKAVKLLYKITGLNPDASAKKLAASLDHLPLYLLTSAIAMQNTQDGVSGTPWSYASYNKHLQKLSTKYIEVEHDQHIRQLGLNKTQHAVMRDAIEQLDHNARNLLIFCSYISPAGITFELLKNFIRVQNETLSDEEIGSQFNVLLYKIQKSSLLQHYPGQLIFSIHRITQEIGRTYTISEKQASTILEAILLPLPSLEYIFNDKQNSIASRWIGLPNNTTLSEETHIWLKTLINYSQLQIASKQHIVKLLYYVGRYYWKNIANMEYLEQGLSVAEEYYGKESLQVAAFLSVLGVAYNSLKWRRSERIVELLERALPIIKKHYGAEYFQFAEIINILGYNYLHLGRCDQARELIERTLTIKEKERKNPGGYEYEQVNLSLITLGIAYTNLEKLKQALELLEPIMKINKYAHIGNGHICSILIIILYAHIHLGKHEQAKELLELQLLERRFSDRSADAFYYKYTIDSLHSISELHITLNKCELVKELLEQVLPILKKYFDDWDILKTSINLWFAYIGLGMHENAKKLAEQISQQMKTINRGDISGTLLFVRKVNRLGVRYNELNKHKQSKELLEQALPTIEKYFDNKHPEFAVTLRILGKAHIELGEPDQAKRLLEQSLSLMEEYYGNESHHVAMGLTILGHSYIECNELWHAKKLLDRAFLIVKNNSYTGNGPMAVVLKALGIVYTHLGKFELAKESLERSLPILEQHYGYEHRQVAEVLNHLVKIYDIFGDLQKKNEILERISRANAKNGSTNE